MDLTTIQNAVSELPEADQRKLFTFLVGLRIKQDESLMTELSARLDDRDPENWVRAADAKRRLACE